MRKIVLFMKIVFRHFDVGVIIWPRMAWGGSGIIFPRGWKREVLAMHRRWESE